MWQHKYTNLNICLFQFNAGTWSIDHLWTQCKEWDAFFSPLTWSQISDSVEQMWDSSWLVKQYHHSEDKSKPKRIWECNEADSCSLPLIPLWGPCAYLFSNRWIQTQSDQSKRSLTSWSKALLVIILETLAKNKRNSSIEINFFPVPCTGGLLQLGKTTWWPQRYTHITKVLENAL